jgi:hypothetical protein
MGDSTWTLELGCLEGEMTMVTREGETYKRRFMNTKI